MTIIEGNLRKMKTSGYSPVQYELHLGEEIVKMNDLVGKTVALEYLNLINCVDCGRKTSKSFAQGFCFPCFQNSPHNAPCIIRPELCEGHLGKGRDPEWEQKHHVQPHIVYLAVSSNLKVGVTRATQIPIRWVDQGAWKAMVLAETPNRYLAGKIEVALKDHMSDKTSWQKMLKNDLKTDVDLLESRSLAAQLIDDELKQYLSKETKLWEIQYPVIRYPQKVKSINLEKTPKFELELEGIKGQYLLFNGGAVINIRKYGGYRVKLSY